MSKIVFLIFAAGLAAIGAVAIHINDVNARQPTEFIQVSVLAEHKADYGVDEQVIAIPAVSVDIIEEAARDFQSQSSVRIITYTALPTKEPSRDHEEEKGSESVDEIKHDNGQGNGNNQGNAVETGNNVNQGNTGNGGSNPNNGNGNNGNNGNGNGRKENKNKNKDKGNGGVGGNDKVEETKP